MSSRLRGNDREGWQEHSRWSKQHLHRPGHHPENQGCLCKVLGSRAIGSGLCFKRASRLLSLNQFWGACKYVGVFFCCFVVVFFFFLQNKERKEK